MAREKNIKGIERAAGEKNIQCDESTGTRATAVFSPPGFTILFFGEILVVGGNEISAEISPKFANSERKGTSNSKNEISMNSDRNFGDFDRNSVIFDRKMMSVVIFPTVPEVK